MVLHNKKCVILEFCKQKMSIKDEKFMSGVKTSDRQLKKSLKMTQKVLHVNLFNSPYIIFQMKQKKLKLKVIRDKKNVK